MINRYGTYLEFFIPGTDNEQADQAMEIKRRIQKARYIVM